MPKAKKNKSVPVAPLPPEPATPKITPPKSVPIVSGLPVIYDQLEITEYSTASPKGPLTIADMKGLLGWETETEFIARKMQEKPGTKPEAWKWTKDTVEVEIKGTGVKYNVPIHCVNVAGEKVICRYNANNRPFDSEWCQKLIHTILYGQWAGPYTVPGETVNGETIRISRYGRTLSGQHQMTACILAGEYLAKARSDGVDEPDEPRFPAWVGKDEPFLETIVITGMSESPRILMTVDYVKPRSAADVFYTSPVFDKAGTGERKELCKMLASAVDLLWTRTDTKGYRTHPEIVGFLERHQRLLKCVEHLFEENASKEGRKISKMRLSAGNCAAIMYLMAASGTSDDASDGYRNMEPPSEKGIDFSLWDKAEEFWTLLAQSRDFMPLRVALGALIDSSPGNEDNQGMGGRWIEKLAVLAKAWAAYKELPPGTSTPFLDVDLSLSYNDLDDEGNKLPDGQVKLLDIADFTGIDCPESVGKGRASKSEPTPPAPSKEEIDKAREEALKRRAANK